MSAKICTLLRLFCPYLFSDDTSRLVWRQGYLRLNSNTLLRFSLVTWSFYILPEKRKRKYGRIPDAFLPQLLPAWLPRQPAIWLYYLTTVQTCFMILHLTWCLFDCQSGLLPACIYILHTHLPACSNACIGIWYCAGWISRRPVRPFPPSHPPMSVLFSLRSCQCECETCHTKLLLCSPCSTVPLQAWARQSMCTVRQPSTAQSPIYIEMTKLPSTGKANDAITQSDCRKVTTNMHPIGHGRELMLLVRGAMHSSEGGESADSGMWWGQFFSFSFRCQQCRCLSVLLILQGPLKVRGQNCDVTVRTHKPLSLHWQGQI